MAIMCIKLGAATNLESKISRPLYGPHMHPMVQENIPSRASNEEAFRMGDYRDILNLTRVLVRGPQSKADVDIIIERYFSQSLKIFRLLYDITFRRMSSSSKFRLHF